MLGCIASDVQAQGKPGDAKIVAQAKKAVTALLKSSRVTLSGLVTRLNRVDLQYGGLLEVGQRLVNESSLAQTALQQHKNLLNQAGSEQTAASITLGVLPAIVRMHNDLLSFVNRYRSEVGLPLPPGTGSIPDAPLIGSESANPGLVRSAMASVIESQASALDRVYVEVEQSRAFMGRVRDEYRAISQFGGGELTVYGLDHYWSRLRQQFDVQTQLVVNSTAFFTGKNSAGAAALPIVPCDPPGTVRTLPAFNGELNQLASTANAGEAYLGWVSDFVNNNLLRRYDGVPAEGIGGYVTHWPGCRNTLLNNLVLVRNDINIARARGDLASASALDLLANDMLAQITQYGAETDSILHRRRLILEIVGSAGAFAAPQIETATPGAWKRAVTASSGNVKALFEFYAQLYQAQEALLRRADTQIETLAAIGDATVRSAALDEEAARIQSEIDNGWSRLLVELDQARLALRTMAVNLRGGSVFMSTTISVYGDTQAIKKSSAQTALTVTVPQELNAATAAVATYTGKVAESVRFVQDISAKIQQYSQLRSELDLLLPLYKRQVAQPSLNPIYTALVQRLFAPVRSDKTFKRLKGAIEAEARNVQNAFKGILPAREGRLTIGDLRAAKKAAAGGDLTKKLTKSKAALLRALAAEIDDASKPFLENKTLSEVVQRAEHARDVISAIGSSLPKR